MDPGLSRRSLKVLAAAGGAAPHQQQQWGSQQQHTIDRDGDDATLIDLSRATNEVAHAELLEFFKSTVGEDVTTTLIPTLTLKHSLALTLAKPPTYNHWDNYLLPSLQASYDFSPVKSRIKAVVLCNPNMPLSRCYPRETLLDLMEFCQERGLHLVCDEGCIISQSSPSLNTALSTLTTPPSTLPSLYLTSLLSWSQLPTLLALTTERLTYSCHILATFLQRHDVEFVVPTHGVVLFARLARTAASKGEEKRFFEALERGGVRVGRGEKYAGVERCWGWAGLGFGVGVEVMEEAVRRMERVMSGEGR
ncbi:Aminotransferase GliI [Pyrenophora tritici-repentis]|uniref:Aminotransferase GliI n=2 Tax=Pyrenophora tritici-repentis TaxID=45151 RepID=A0A922SZW4_9PLEO|nr:uncharacterized protein PTRG_01527 [Pyrenophora tritici-repentis Pt-1C-BFP]EDU40965.1 conserved hypothetical protein [Pyrenophora tritici-repentis Pt-1C-BFP]KAI1513658.1 Aminotransferase GliI [Pyrenophora tritici-repentis]KAI1674222.1 Aminotransferase GliI [Pyrenophora tritici-repentis]KAI1688670.1 Aminotransferase GliI [Pyrenophora tritici-repentis]